jgi:magnesium-transporting ATPase (P-type)
MKGKGRCYIYGSTHIKMPREDIIREILGRVDYVLLEGFSTVCWRSLIRKRPSATLLILGALTYFFILRISTRIMDKWYRLKGRPSFRDDMSYVRDYAIRLGKKTELVDASLEEVFSAQIINFKHILRAFNIITITIILIIAILYTYATFTPHSNPLVMLYSNPLFITALILILTLAIPIICFALFVQNINEFRDAKVVKRTKELVEMGYNVLIVRGELHIEYLSSELQKHSIVCEIYET